MNRRCWASRGCPWPVCASTNGGHTQLTLRKGVEVLDGICFGRSDLTGMIAEGDAVDVVARLSSRRFAGLETLQLEIRDVAPAGHLAADPRVHRPRPMPARASRSRPDAPVAVVR